jgi:hypothetical protein
MKVLYFLGCPGELKSCIGLVLSFIQNSKKYSRTLMGIKDAGRPLVFFDINRKCEDY